MSKIAVVLCVVLCVVAASATEFNGIDQSSFGFWRVKRAGSTNRRLQAITDIYLLLSNNQEEVRQHLKTVGFVHSRALNRIDTIRARNNAITSSRLWELYHDTDLVRKSYRTPETVNLNATRTENKRLEKTKADTSECLENKATNLRNYVNGIIMSLSNNRTAEITGIRKIVRNCKDIIDGIVIGETQINCTLKQLLKTKDRVSKLCVDNFLIALDTRERFYVWLEKLAIDDCILDAESI